VEVIYAALGGMIPMIGFGMIVGAIVSGAWILTLPGVIFSAFGVAMYFLFPILKTASRLSLDANAQVLSWSATVGHGEVPVHSIVRVRTEPRRPTVYEVSSDDGSSFVFWLGVRRRSIRPFFDTLQTANPRIDLSNLYETSRRWGSWRT
jgi:hypothetical protein